MGDFDRTQVYRLDGRHWFKDFVPAWVFLVRSRCTCGWVSGKCLTLNHAANELLIHEAMNGTRVN